MTLLSAPETTEGMALVFARHRQRFVARRAILRLVVAQFVDIAPRDLRIVRQVSGRLEVVGSHARVSLAHSGDRAIFAIRAGRDVGIDLERVDDSLPLAGLSQLALTESERRHWERFPQPSRAGAFYRYWTVKEAV